MLRCYSTPMLLKNHYDPRAEIAKQRKKKKELNEMGLLEQNPNLIPTHLFFHKCIKHEEKNNDQIENEENRCPGGKECKNYELIEQLKEENKKYKIAIKDLNKMIHYYEFLLNRREQLNKNLTKENSEFKIQLKYKLKEQNYQKLIKKSNEKNENKNTLFDCGLSNIKSNQSIHSFKEIKDTKIIKDEDTSEEEEEIRKKNEKNLSYYENLNEMINKRSKNKI
ncbi:MAG: hypothetical protein MJ252_07520 [archaeon]|nr:hypothetical protein [archaeon]